MTAQRSTQILFLILVLFLTHAGSLVAAPAQPPQQASAPSSQSFPLQAVVDTKAGQPSSQLTQKDFTVLENKTPRPITSFKVASPEDEPINIIIVVDGVNIPHDYIPYARAGITKFLKANNGRLTSPTSIVILTDDGLQFDNTFTTDGNALAEALDHRTIGLRAIQRDSQWEPQERLDASLKAFEKLITFSRSIPGRKFVLWVAPGWPLLSGPNVELTWHQEERVFNEVVGLSTEIRDAGLTVYSLNSLGVDEPTQQANFYLEFVKGLTKPNNAFFGNLGLQVLAVQSGGLVLEANTDIQGMIQRCMTDTQSWYEIGFDPLPSNKPNEYHHIEVKVDRPGLVARTRDGYYANPEPIPVQ